MKIKALSLAAILFSSGAHAALTQEEIRSVCSQNDACVIVFNAHAYVSMMSGRVQGECDADNVNDDACNKARMKNLELSEIGTKAIKKLNEIANK